MRHSVIFHNPSTLDRLLIKFCCLWNVVGIKSLRCSHMIGKYQLKLERVYKVNLLQKKGDVQCLYMHEKTESL